MKQEKVLIVGGGIFGITAAISLRRRGYEVHLFEKGKIPNPDASSTDASKMIRADYGHDTFYMDMMLDAFKGWEHWNEQWPAPLYHPTGSLFLTHEKMQAGSLEYDSKKALEERGVSVDNINAKVLEERFPNWNTSQFTDGYFNPIGGWAQSGKVVRQLADIAILEGVELHEETSVMSLMTNSHQVGGLFTTDGMVYSADKVIVAAGVWSSKLIEELADKVTITAHPVYFFKPKNPQPYKAETFPCWFADVSKTGWYGFPYHPEGYLKIAHHGIGEIVDPNQANEIAPHYYPGLNTFLADHLPGMEYEPISSARLCYYADTWDSDFYICPHPQQSNLIIAFGGSGHGFKFAPILGDIIADVTEGKNNPYANRFKWRERGEERQEAARMIE